MTAVSDTFREDIEEQLGEVRRAQMLLQCVLTPDDAEDPQEVIWKIVHSRNEALVTAPLKRAFEADGDEYKVVKSIFANHPRI